MLKRLPRRTTWRDARFGLRRARVDAFRVYAMLFVILAHSDTALGATDDGAIRGLQLVMNVVGRAAVPLFLLFAGEHLGPRLLRNRVPGAAWAYTRRLAIMFVLASCLYWAFDLAKLVRSHGPAGGVVKFAARLAEEPIKLLLYGARPHLWFLVVLILIVAVAAPILARMRVRILVLGAAMLYGLGLAIGPYGNQFGLAEGHWWYEWVLQSPLFFALGVLFALDRQGKRWVPAALGLIAAGVAVHALEVHWISTTYGTSPFRLAMLMGTVLYAAGAAMLAFTPGATAPERIVARLAPYVPVVYLNHMLFVELLRPRRGQFPELLARFGLPVIAAVLSFGSAWFVAASLRHRRRRPRRPRADDDDALRGPRVGDPSPEVL